MCFSATASFAGSTILTGIGGASVQKSSKKTRLFALIPLLFAVQQGIEGAQWMALSTGSANVYLGYAFLFFAFLLWPIYMPLSFMRMEVDVRRIRLMRAWLVLGICVSALLVVGLLLYPLQITQATGHIEYFIDIPYPMIISLVYTLAVCVPGLLSSYFYVRIFSALAFISSALSALVYTQAYVSVWCFFAALLSVLIIFGVQECEKKLSVSAKSR